MARKKKDNTIDEKALNSKAFSGIALTDFENPSGLVTQSELYQNRMALAKLKKMEESAEEKALNNKKAAIEIDKVSGAICYKKVAEDEFSKAISGIMNRLRGGANTLSQAAGLTTWQADVVTNWFNDILQDIADIDIDLSTTAQTDAALYHFGGARDAEKGLS